MAVIIVILFLYPSRLMVNYQQTAFLISAHSVPQLPADYGSEVAFAGRSNSGKSSVINLLTRQKALARTSKTPGRTQSMNVYTVGPERRLVDLPGYGYAKVSKQMREHWSKTIELYLLQRRSLSGLVLITDIRREMCDADQSMVDWCQRAGLPVHVLLNKADKLGRGAAKNTLLRIEKALQGRQMGVQLFSATRGEGVEELVSCLNAWLAPPEAGHTALAEY